MTTKPRILKEKLPRTAWLWQYFKAGDFIDGYAVASPLSARDAADIGFRMPGWATALLKLRNLAVRPFGLRTERPEDMAGIGLFPIEHERSGEIVLGFDDRHLNFRIGILGDGTMIRMGTWVRPHNIAGRLYLACVMPFHILIVRNAMARIGRATA
ncbi:DUF2867 domain-containing protein [Frigidibacter sp. RF13]|uniref:DUF2867 domain-containing protein n=1 Tax=Frigidibacter sp. RF13 TaxID=2997340 RepID=UPI00227020D9|nr:DUF2867 domain-containing protein [Frigidibacter sp. RF13]MCY1127248.1 DUF2867 domain-containing protein [Frigidibacter sp. RF13]